MSNVSNNDESEQKEKQEFLLPKDALLAKASLMECDVFSETFADKMDKQDDLAHLRNKFYYPTMTDLNCVQKDFVENMDSECIYLCGNSLGLQPKSADEHMKKSLDSWAKLGVLSHESGALPAAHCDLPGIEATARLVGAEPIEVALMNGLTINLHLLLVSFYQPTKTRNKILMEARAFPSDIYAVKSQIRFHGYDPSTSLIELAPRQVIPSNATRHIISRIVRGGHFRKFVHFKHLHMEEDEGEHTLRLEDILKVIEEQGSNIAVVLFSGVQYYTGQKFDMEAITKAGHKQDCIVGFDLAHAVGNVKLCLHDWDIDFACWCSYKYLNSGAGGLAGAFIHKKHIERQMPKLHGWWSNIAETRFLMKDDPDIDIGIAGLRISNPPPWLACLNLASLEIFEQTSMDQLTKKQFLLTGYLELLLSKNFQEVTIITPSDPSQRGCQLSLMFDKPLTDVHVNLERRGAICDIRMPNVIRVAPIPLYNTFKDVYHFTVVLREALVAAAIS